MTALLRQGSTQDTGHKEIACRLRVPNRTTRPNLRSQTTPSSSRSSSTSRSRTRSCRQLGRALVRRMEKTREAAAQDKRSMSEELAPNFATYADAMETYADFAAMNRVIDAYNLAQDADAEQLERIQLLLKQPYFAKVALQFKPGQEPKDALYRHGGHLGRVVPPPCRGLAHLPWPRCTTTRTTAPRPTRPMGAPSTWTSSFAASSTSRTTA